MTRPKRDDDREDYEGLEELKRWQQQRIGMERGIWIALKVIGIVLGSLATLATIVHAVVELIKLQGQ